MSHHHELPSDECPYEESDIEDLVLKIFGTFDSGMHVGLILDALVISICDVIIEHVDAADARALIAEIQAELDEVPFYFEETKH